MDGFSPAAAITVLYSLEAGWLAGSLNGWMHKWRESDGGREMKACDGH